MLWLTIFLFSMFPWQIQKNRWMDIELLAEPILGNNFFIVNKYLYKKKMCTNPMYGSCSAVTATLNSDYPNNILNGLSSMLNKEISLNLMQWLYIYTIHAGEPGASCCPT
jgi:hypothetical protein